jgi:multimeric flavodoxin WrbA
MKLKALALNGALKSEGGSSTQKMIDLVPEALKQHDVEGSSIRLAELNIKPGVTSDEGEGDAQPDIRKQIPDSHILIMGTPIWLGQPVECAQAGS